MSGELRQRLTPIEESCLEAIKEHLQEYGYGPTLRELAGSIGASTAGIEHAVKHLADLGKIRRVPGIHRGILEVVE